MGWFCCNACMLHNEANQIILDRMTQCWALENDLCVAASNGSSVVGYELATLPDRLFRSEGDRSDEIGTLEMLSTDVFALPNAASLLKPGSAARRQARSREPECREWRADR